jgi:hypothetical protein
MLNALILISLSNETESGLARLLKRLPSLAEASSQPTSDRERTPSQPTSDQSLKGLLAAAKSGLSIRFWLAW